MLEKASVWKNVISFSSKCDQAELMEWPALEQKGMWGIISLTSRKLVPVWYEQYTEHKLCSIHIHLDEGHAWELEIVRIREFRQFEHVSLQAHGILAFGFEGGMNV